jgi:hypothetical protein
MSEELFNPQDHEIAVTGDPTLDVPNAKLRAGEIAAAQAEQASVAEVGSEVGSEAWQRKFLDTLAEHALGNRVVDEGSTKSSAYHKGLQERGDSNHPDSWIYGS